MDKEAIEKYCLTLRGSTNDYQREWEADRFFVGGKIYAMIGGDSKGEPILTLKCDPFRSEELRENFERIIPGYHMNKTHWNSIYLDSNLPTELIENLISHSYTIVLHSLPKKVQKEIIQQ